MPPQHEFSNPSVAMLSPPIIDTGLDNTPRHRHCLDSPPIVLQSDKFLDDLKDVLTFLKMQEFSYSRRTILNQQDHQREIESKPSYLPPFHDQFRPIMISWMYSVADTYRLMPIVVSTGVYILDTCAIDLLNNSSDPSDCQRGAYLLIAVTAFNMAVKCHETKVFPLDQLAKLVGPLASTTSAAQSCNPDTICSTERRLLHRCGWKLYCPTPHDFLLQFATVLRDEYQDAVVSFAVLHLKRSLLWEHILHQEKGEGGLFSTCTKAYAAFLFGMEQAGLPLGDKQAASQSLLRAADLSIQTPKLSEAYAWLSRAQFLQNQLEKQNRLRQEKENRIRQEKENRIRQEKEINLRQENETRLRPSTNTSNGFVSTTAFPDQQLEEPSRDPQHVAQGAKQKQLVSYKAPEAAPKVVVPIEQDYETDSVDNSSKSVASSVISELSIMSSVISDLSVVFCSYNLFGDAIEVVPTESKDRSNSMKAPIIVTVDESTNLVLSESMDDDGFEVSFEKDMDSEVGLITSPREVSTVF